MRPSLKKTEPPIKAMMKAADVTRKELAGMTGRSETHLSYVIHGRRESAQLTHEVTALLSARIKRKR